LKVNERDIVMTESFELRLKSTTYLLRGTLAWRPFAAVHGRRLEVLALERDCWNLYVVDAYGRSVGLPHPVIAEEVTAFARCGSLRLIVGAVGGRPRSWLLDEAGAVLSERYASIRMRPVCVASTPFGVYVGYRDPTVVSVFDLTSEHPKHLVEITLEGRTHEYVITAFGSEIALVRAGAAARPVEVWRIPAHGDPARHTSVPGTEGAVAPSVVQVKDRLAVLWATQGTSQTVLLQWIRPNGELDGTPVELVCAKDISATFAAYAPDGGLAVGYTTRALAENYYGPGPRAVGRQAHHYDTRVATCDTKTGRVGYFLRVSDSERECHWVDGSLLVVSGEACDLKVAVYLLADTECSQAVPGP
jgi:hypothetical protein